MSSAQNATTASQSKPDDPKLDTASCTPPPTSQKTKEKVELTAEMKERIRKNRERALQIQAERKRKKLQEQEQEEEKRKLQKKEDCQQGSTRRNEREDLDCEEWEIGMSEWITKSEAVSKYCLPEGTLAVCEFQTKDNPHRKGWAPMKLFRRSEIRERAYKRFKNGKEGLIAERYKREQRRLDKDLKAAAKIFESK